MPLPKPPAKRASLLSAADFESQAAQHPGKRPQKTRAAVEPAAPALLELHDAAHEAGAVVAKPANKVAAPAVPLRKAPGHSRKPRGTGPATLFVLDTNVLMHDPTSLFRFDEHDIYLPMITLEELDSHKRGMTEVARNARQVSRDLDALAANMPTRNAAGMSEGLALSSTGHREAGGKLFFQTNLVDVTLPAGLPQGKADNQILGVVQSLREQHAPREVVLVSKDINMRVKARALGLATDDYQNDKTLDDLDLMYAGSMALPPDFWSKHGKTVESWQSGQHTFYRVSGPAMYRRLSVTRPGTSRCQARRARSLW